MFQVIRSDPTLLIPTDWAISINVNGPELGLNEELERLWKVGISDGRYIFLVERQTSDDGKYSLVKYKYNLVKYKYSLVKYKYNLV